MTYEIFKGPTEVKFNQYKSAYLPFIGSGFHNSYFLTGGFEFDILDKSGGTCGAPAVLSSDTMAAFLTEKGGKIFSDGSNITVTVPVNQKLLLVSGGSEKDKWQLYKKLVEVPDVTSVAIQDFWMLPEYVTWVEQKFYAAKAGTSPVMILDQALVLNFASRIKKLGLPLGKLTIDDGWQQRLGEQDWTDGYWKPDTKKFPDMEGLCCKLQDEGFVPSLWMGIPSVPLSAPIIKSRPELFDENLKSCPISSSRCYYKPSDKLVEHFTDIIYPYAKMGFRKFKFDFFYGPRHRMREIMKCLYTAVRGIDTTIEIESHHADPFFSVYNDVFRMNDVIINPGFDWKGLTLAHLNLGINNAYNCILNLDHAGGNSPSVCEDDYIEHLRLFDLVPDIQRYPVLSLLPDRFSEKAVKEIKRYLDNHSSNN